MSERVSFSALRDTLNSPEYEEQPVVSNSADATLRRQEKEIQRLKKANFNLKLQVFHLEEKLGLLPNDFEGDTTNKSTLSMEDSGLQSPKANLLQVLEEKEREVAQRDELLKKARKVIFSLQEKIKELYERKHSLHNASVVKEQIANGDTNNNFLKPDNTWPSSLSETFQVFRKRWNLLAENFPNEMSQIPKEAIVSHDWAALENIFHHVIESLPLFQNLAKNSDNSEFQSPKSSNDNQKSPKFAHDYEFDGRKSNQVMKPRAYSNPPSPLEMDIKNAHGPRRSPEKTHSNQNTPTRHSWDAEYVPVRKLQDILSCFAEIPELRLSQISPRSKLQSDDIIRYLKMIYEQTFNLQEKVLKCQDEIQYKEARVEDALVAKRQAEESLLALHEEREQLLQQAGSVETQLDETIYYYRNENEKLLDELQKSKEELQEAQAFYKDKLTGHTEELEKQREYYEAEIARISEELEETRSQLEESQKHYQDILERQTNEFNEMQENYENQIADLSEEFDQRTKELKEKQRVVEAEVNRLTEELEQVTNQLDETERHYQAENEELVEELDRRTKELQELRDNKEAETVRLSQELDQMGLKLEELKNQYQDERAQKLEEYEKQRNEWERTKEEYEMDIARISVELQQTRNENKNMHSCHEEEMARLNEELHRQTSEMEEAKQRYESEVNQLSEQLEKTKQQLEESESHYRLENERISNELQQVSKRLEEELSKAEQHAALSQMLNEYEEWLSVLQTDNEHHFQRGQPVDCVLRRTLLSEIDEQNNRLTQYESQLEQLKHDYNCLVKEKTSLSSSNQEIEEESRIYREQLEMVQKEKEELKVNQEELQFQNASLKQQAQLIAQELEKCRNELCTSREEAKKLNLKISEEAIIEENLRKRNEIIERELKCITEERDSLRRAIDTYKEQIESMTLEVSTLRTNLTSLEQSYRSKEDELENALQDKQQISKQIDIVREELETALKKYENQNGIMAEMEISLSEKQHTIEKLQEELVQKQTQLNLLSKELEESSSEHEILQQKIAKLESDQSDLTRQLESASKPKSTASEEFATKPSESEKSQLRLYESTGVQASQQTTHSVRSNENDTPSQIEATLEHNSIAVFEQVNSSQQPQVIKESNTEAEPIVASSYDQHSETGLPTDLPISRDKTELEQLLRQRDYENLVLQQETESYYEEWKKMEKESELLRSMLQSLEDEQIQIRKCALELREAMEDLFEANSADFLSVKQNLQQYFNRLFEKLMIEASYSATECKDSLGHTTFQVNSIGKRVANESDWTDSKDLDDSCQQVFSLFSYELQNLQAAMQQLSENVPSYINCENGSVQCSNLLPDMTLSGHSVEFEELGSYIRQLTQLLSVFRKISIAAKQALQSEMSLGNISVYEVSQPVFGNSTTTDVDFGCHFSHNSLPQASDAKKLLDRNEIETISQVAIDALATKKYLMESMESFNVQVEQVLSSVAKRIDFISEKQRSLGKYLKSRHPLPKVSSPLKPDVSGENLLGIHLSTSMHKSEQHTWEDVALKQIEETQRLINSAHQRLAWEKARLIQSVFGHFHE
ncbi:hypothetical protein Gasu2_33160 [Galdieria sulphuraria]|uniref:Centrosomin N-terminal motif 1 domain-containing protein n=1 Tax=Galdieria sulphuraria TaxID=130081 RepID=M2XKI4_GALSU|nr:uncharacterized protein Gasu_21060 [Galdieria sulphuraria]EME30647.1 hypothetical protein Gasu_21060 [Galdieria sulphuraria]GJD09044.1 hypothetical protein Gasu2_33160 [Galdieria sulphuraria]|eukprot:XP_005707167.1 hypothetical protein Gasu_21060 [Galdieria sulphuraria]